MVLLSCELHVSLSTTSSTQRESALLPFSSSSFLGSPTCSVLRICTETEATCIHEKNPGLRIGLEPKDCNRHITGSPTFFTLRHHRHLVWPISPLSEGLLSVLLSRYVTPIVQPSPPPLLSLAASHSGEQSKTEKNCISFKSSSSKS